MIPKFRNKLLDVFLFKIIKNVRESWNQWITATHESAMIVRFNGDCFFGTIFDSDENENENEYIINGVAFNL